jgi:hypothetical protein
MAKGGTGHKNVIFIGLMLGMLVAAVSQTIVSPAMPVIVAELWGIEHYSWIATSALLMSAVPAHAEEAQARLRRLRRPPARADRGAASDHLGGTTYPWGSWQVSSLYVVGAFILVGFVVNEFYAVEPVLPLRLWKNSIFTLSNVSNMAIAMTMFGAIFFIPVYAQGVIGVNVTNSGAVLIPLTASMIFVSIAVGRLITRTGRYKGFW